MWQYGCKRQTNARHEGFKGREVEMLRGLRSCCRDVERFEVERSHTRRLSRSSDGSQNRLSCLESPGSCNHVVSPLQGLLSCAIVHLGAHATKLWSVAPPGLWVPLCQEIPDHAGNASHPLLSGMTVGECSLFTLLQLVHALDLRYTITSRPLDSSTYFNSSFLVSACLSVCNR